MTFLLAPVAAWAIDLAATEALVEEREGPKDAQSDYKEIYW